MKQGIRAWIGSGLLVAGILGMGAAQASTEAPRADRSGAEVYASLCAACHDSGTVPRAPHRVKFPMLGPAAVLAALETGAMQAQGASLTPGERRNVAEYLGEAKLPDTAAATPTLARCDARHAKFDFSRPPSLTGWSMTQTGTRFNAKPGLKAADVPRLKLKWAFGFPGATRARSQPTIGAGAVFVGSQDGTVYALDYATGCVRWTFKADAEVRNGPILDGWKKGDRKAAPRLYFGDFIGNAYAIDARTGALVWKQRVDSHPRLTLTGSPRLFEGRLYVPMSSSEWAAAADPTYECCTFRGGVAALDAATGKVIWRGYTIQDEPRANGERNSAGALRHHPAGAPVWNMPTIDAKRRRLYVGSGEAYTSPAAPQSDAVIAFDLDTGKQAWFYQSLPGDAWNMACFIGGGPNCPVENGPDVDIGSNTILHTLPDGREVILAGQKSAHTFALDPDTGKLLWKVKLGRGGVIGGVHWGMATDATTLYAPVADTPIFGNEPPTAKPGLFALDPANGAIRWYTPAPDVCPDNLRPACDKGLSAPPTAMPGIVFAGAFDGRLRAYETKTGSVVWEYDTLREFDTVSGMKARGGSIESAGPVIAEGRVLVNSGYLFGGRMAGNVLLMFSVDGK